MLRSPFLEKLREEGLEVILFTDAIDEYMMQHLQEYDDKKLINISKDNLKLGGKDKDEKAADKALKVGGPSPQQHLPLCMVQPAMHGAAQHVGCM